MKESYKSRWGHERTKTHKGSAPKIARQKSALERLKISLSINLKVVNPPHYVKSMIYQDQRQIEILERKLGIAEPTFK